jgi:TonB-linked SusC/RagA family outer membrane protein
MIYIPTYRLKSLPALYRYMVLGIAAIFLSLNSFGQGQTVTGQVTDQKTGETLVGVSVFIKGTTSGTTTGIDGSYTINVSSPEAVLVFSYVGFKLQEFEVGERSVINVALVDENTMLSEVVVVGYGLQRKESVVGSISSIDNKTIVSLPVSNITQSLAGKLSGVQVVQPSGEIGLDEAEIFIRGQATYGDAKPLIVVDGIIRDGFAQIDPNEVASINILKDASATAVYGVKGANGVIIVTTRRGETGKPVISFTTQTAMTMPTRIPRPLDSYRSAMLSNLQKMGGDWSAPTYSTQDMMYFRTGASPYTNPDFTWTDVMIKDQSTLSQYNLNVSGGTNTVKILYFRWLPYTGWILQL